jgi:hypothetical protein
MTASATRTRWNQVKAARKGKTLAALERAAMRWYRGYKDVQSDALEGTFATEIVAIHREK